MQNWFFFLVGSGCLFIQATLASDVPLNRVTTTQQYPTFLRSTHLHQLFQAASNVFSGDSPAGDAAFAEIAKLGVTTLISVDGSRPDVETARRHGLRYVHLPIGYDAVPEDRTAALIKATQQSTGPVYVHCHHGKHRGPAAVAVICAATGGWNTNQTLAWLQLAGTGAEYSGLYRSVREFRPPDAAALSRILELPEVSNPSSLVEAMVAVDEEFDRLKIAQKSSWSKIPGQPDLTPAHAATILAEHFRELLRTPDTAGRSSEYREKMAAAEKAATHLSGFLREKSKSAETRNSAFQTLGNQCAACHKQFRN